MHVQPKTISARYGSWKNAGSRLLARTGVSPMHAARRLRSSSSNSTNAAESKPTRLQNETYAIRSPTFAAADRCAHEKEHAMSKLVAIMSMSLDGYVADLND